MATVGVDGDLSQVKEQMLMRLDEIGEDYENLKMVVVSYCANKAEQTRSGQNDRPVLMDVDCTSGSGTCGRGSEEHDVSQQKNDGNTSRWIVERRQGERQRQR